MRVNIYAEEMTDRIEIISKTIEDQVFTGCRFYLYLPVTQPGLDPRYPDAPTQIRGPFMHGPDDDDSAAVTFWGKADLRPALITALEKLDEHYGGESMVQVAEVPAPVESAAVVLEICRERTRQIDVERFDSAHDDEYEAGELVAAAIVYASNSVDDSRASGNWWPWHMKWYKPTTPRHDLIKAGALIIAEIERIDRAIAKVDDGLDSIELS